MTRHAVVDAGLAAKQGGLLNQAAAHAGAVWALTALPSGEKALPRRDMRGTISLRSEPENLGLQVGPSTCTAFDHPEGPLTSLSRTPGQPVKSF